MPKRKFELRNKGKKEVEHIWYIVSTVYGWNIRYSAQY